jgi:hypothetical protein
MQARPKGRRAVEAAAEAKGATERMSRSPGSCYGAADRIRTGDVQLWEAGARLPDTAIASVVADSAR